MKYSISKHNKPYPLKFSPKFVEKIWGGQRLASQFNKPIPPSAAIGESWEIFDMDDESGRVTNGPWVGRSLHDLLEEYPREIMGNAKFSGQFPLLIKFIDASQVLSVQVHPDDGQAISYGDSNGKTEAWLIIGCEAGSEIICGLKPGIDKMALTEAIKQKNLADQLLRFPIKKGDVFFMRAGTVHAIGAGVFLLEIQQNSNATFRMYDWDRVGLNGKPRILHMEDALSVIDYGVTEADIRPAAREMTDDDVPFSRLVECDYFVIDKFLINGVIQMERRKGRFEILINLAGSCAIHSPTSDYDPVEMNPGDVVLVPAELERFSISGIRCELIRTFAH